MSRKRTVRDDSYAVRAMAIAEFIDTYNVGSHITKEKGGMVGVLDSLQSFVTKYMRVRCCQIFMRNPRGFSVVHKAFYESSPNPTHTPSGIEGVRQFVEERNLQFYVHAPYTLNLCANATKEIDSAEVAWAQAILDEDMYHARMMGCKGVVVHTGFLVGRPLEEGLLTMENMVRKTLKFATRTTKLLLETPAGEKTSKGVCDTIFDFMAFFDRFTSKEQKRMGICVDTCHVFATGEDPLEYLKLWHELRTSSSSSESVKIPAIELVHLNDSSSSIGSRVDDHAPIGEGHIGFEKMKMIAEWCVVHDIPMVKEWSISL